MPQTASKKKELYLGKCLGDLHTKSDVKHLDSPVNIIIRSLNKVFQDAENFDSQGDEERAYIMYMKYFNILKQIKTKADYKNKKEYFDNLIGKNNQLKAIDRAEQLSESLKERYDLKQAEALAKKLSSLETSSKSSDETEITDKTKTKNEKKHVESSKTPAGMLTCSSLYELLKDASLKLILMDVRPRADFTKSHISNTDCINVPEDILTSGSTVSHIQSKLPEESKAVWLQRRHADHIILIDWKSTLENAVVGTPLVILSDALFKHDTDTIIKSEPLILEGGYEQWMLFCNTKTGKTDATRPVDSLSSALTSVSPKASSGVITCVNLCGLLRDASTKLIVMDVRPGADFAKSHISHTDCISVPEEILTPGSIVSHIQSKLPEESKAVWLQRKHADHIILLDWKSTSENVVVGTPLRTLKDALYKYDLTTVLKSEPLILEGGYEQWLMFYPTMTTNAHVARPSDLNQVKPPSPTMTLDFDYPDLVENVHTTATSATVITDETSPNNSGSFATAPAPGVVPVPQFDRSLKPAQSADVLSFSNASLDSGIGSSLNNAESVSAVQRRLSEQSATIAPSILHTSIQAGTKTTEKNTNLHRDQVENSPKSINLSFKNNLATDLSNSVIHREEKEAELKNFQHSRDNKLKQDQKRLEDVERQLRELEQIKKKEEKDVADLMRIKRKLKEEKLRQEEESKRFAAEEARRSLALEQARLQEEEKKHRLEEVEKMRLDRKKEELKELAKIQLEEERKKKEADDKIKLMLDEERQAERIREAALAKKKEEEEEERQRRAEQENTKKEEAEKELLQLEQEFEQQRLKTEEAKRQQKEQEEAARLEEEIRQKEKMEREIKQKEQMERDLERQRKEAAEKIKMEEAAREQAQIERDAAEKLNQLKVAEQQASKIVPSNMLPPGWEKRLDRATNRYFYIDHNKTETHWKLPEGSASARPTDTYTAHLKDEPSVSSSRGMSRSHSSPNIKKQLEEEEELSKKSTPSIDRSIKPNFSAASTVPKQTAYITRKRDLNPVYGNVGPALTGLRNLGNTCYMNSTIQCLNNTSPLISYFLNGFYLNDINRESSQGMHGEVVDDFAIVVKALWSQQYRSITPRDLKNTVGKYNPMFAGYQQQDSQEFLTFLLDGLHEGLNEVKKAPDIPEQNNENLPDEVTAPLAWKYHKLLHKSIIVELFQGQLKSTLMCLTCKKTSVTFQAFMFLSLPIPASSRCSLKDCIQEFLKPELMTGSSKWKCPHCKVERDSKKKIDIWKLPPILLIGLNRFYSEGMWMQKKTTYVDFPVDDLNFSPNIIGPKPRNNYNLYGISNHYGTMEGGHYTAFCRNPVNKKWYKFDDHDVYEMSSSNVKTSAAFVLYYTSIDMPAPQYKPHL